VSHRRGVRQRRGRDNLNPLLDDCLALRRDIAAAAWRTAVASPTSGGGGLVCSDRPPELYDRVRHVAHCREKCVPVYVELASWIFIAEGELKLVGQRTADLTPERAAVLNIVQLKHFADPQRSLRRVSAALHGLVHCPCGSPCMCSTEPIERGRCRWL
jgi:hypothetical protein